MTKRTAGPWSFQGIGLKFDITARAPMAAKYVGVRIAAVFAANEPMGFGDSPKMDEAAANARLIAAAPDLLAALTLLLQRYTFREQDDEIAQAAVAKATDA